MKKKDFIFIAVATITALIILLFTKFLSSGGDTVCIYVDSKLYKKLPLNIDSVTDINKKNTLVIENGNAYMKSADCPDKLCIKQGKISHSGRDIICLPNRVRITITKKSDIDAVAQ